MSRARSMLTALVLSAPLWVGIAHGYVLTGAKWATVPVPYKINQSSIPSQISGTAIASIEAGFASWSAPTCTSWKATNAGNTTLGQNSNDGQNTILWRSSGWSAQLGDVNSTIGVTLSSYLNNGQLVDADIVFNNVGFSWNTTGTNGSVDTQSIAVHEEGHFLGLDHTPQQSAIMYAAYSGGQKRNLSGDDTDGVCALYPCVGSECAGAGGGTGQTCGTCQKDVQQPGAVCNSAASQCASSPSCDAFISCVQACQTQKCVDSCTQQHTQGAQQFNNFVNCICDTGCATECAQDCGSGTGGTGGGSVGDCCQAHPGSTGCGTPSIETCVCAKDAYCCENEWDEQCIQEVNTYGCGTCSNAQGSSCGLQTEDAACDACLQSQCCAEAQTCANNDGCLTMLDCLSNCSSNDEACVNNCSAQSSTGAAQINALFGCLDTKCAANCGAGGSGGGVGGSGQAGSITAGEGGSAAGQAGSAAAGEAGSGGAAAGEAGSAGAAGSGGAGTPVSVNNDNGEGGCGCKTVGGAPLSASPLAAFASLAALGVFASRRRRQLAQGSTVQ